MSHRLYLVASLLTLSLAVTPRPAAAQHSHDHGAPAAASTATVPPNAQVVNVAVTKEGFVPAVVTVKAGKPVALVVTRQVQRTCATEIVLKDFGVNQSLPLEKPVTVVVTPKKAGTYRFACGMDMIAGELRVQ